MKDNDHVLDERFSGLSDDEIYVLDSALAALDESLMDQATYTTYVRLRLAVEIQLSDRSYDPDSAIEHYGLAIHH
jgi:hypothetical protein